MVGWGLPLALTLAGIFLQIYGPAGDTCWISSDSPMHQFWLDGFWAVLTLVWNVYVIGHSIKIVASKRRELTAAAHTVQKMMCVSLTL